MFRPRKTETTWVGIPKILITEEAAADMWHIVDLNSEEVGWMMRCTKKDNTYLLDKVYLLHQQVHATTTELTEDGLAKLAEELLAKGEDGVKEWNHIRCWFHSHVNMAVEPSVQDDKQMEIFSKDKSIPWMLRGIANKKGDIKFSLFIYEYQAELKDVPWEIVAKTSAEDDPRRKFWKEQCAERVKPLSTVSYSGSAYAGSGAYGGTGRVHYSRRSAAKNFSGKLFGALSEPATTVTSTTGSDDTPVGGSRILGPAGVPVGVAGGDGNFDPIGWPDDGRWSRD